MSCEQQRISFDRRDLDYRIAMRGTALWAPQSRHEFAN
jgi:hypothetical protein